MEPGAQYGEYRLGSRLGVGGQGEVFEATDSLGLRWALKVGHTIHTEDAKALATFAREAAWVNETFARLPRNCGILVGEHYGVCERRFYVKMRLLSGESLASKLQREGRLNLRDALEIARAVASAVAIAHENDALHRDLKPENIFIEESGGIQVLDWGCIHLIEAERVASPTTSGPTCTVGYAALEQYEPTRERLSAATDVYSLGVVLLEMLTGGNPFLGRARAEGLNAGESTPTRTAVVSGSQTTVVNPVHYRVTSKPPIGDATARTADIAELGDSNAALTSKIGNATALDGETTGPWRAAGSLPVVLQRQKQFSIATWQRAGDLDAKVVNLLQRMLQADVAQRSANMREIYDALSDLLYPGLTALRPARPARMRMPVLWLGLLIVASLGLLFVVLSKPSVEAAAPVVAQIAEQLGTHPVESVGHAVVVPTATPTVGVDVTPSSAQSLATSLPGQVNTPLPSARPTPSASPQAKRRTAAKTKNRPPTDEHPTSTSKPAQPAFFKER